MSLLQTEWVGYISVYTAHDDVGAILVYCNQSSYMDVPLSNIFDLHIQKEHKKEISRKNFDEAKQIEAFEARWAPEIVNTRLEIIPFSCLDSMNLNSSLFTAKDKTLNLLQHLLPSKSTPRLPDIL